MSAVVEKEEKPWCYHWPEDWPRYRKIDVPVLDIDTVVYAVNNHHDEHYSDWDERGNEICPSKYVLYLESPDGKDAVALIGKELR